MLFTMIRVSGGAGGRESDGKKSWKEILGSIGDFWTDGAGGMGCGKYVF